MFTYATKNLGRWRHDQPAVRRSKSLGNLQFTFSLAVCAFIVWITFIIVLKVRQEFFLIESYPGHLVKLRDFPGSVHQTFFPAREVAFSLWMFPEGKGSFRVLLDTGSYFSLPRDEKNFEKYLEKRTENIVLSSMLMRTVGAETSRVRIYATPKMDFVFLQNLTSLLSRKGYDDFDFAVER